MSLNKTVKDIVSSVDPRTLTSNTQRALLALLRADGSWVSRGSVRVSNATARMRELRRPEFGGFAVEVATAKELGKPSTTTYYRVNPSSVTPERVKRVFKIST
jgi:hypothetical protein